MKMDKLVYSAQEIKFLNQYFKNYSEFLDEETFLSEEILELLNRSPAMYRAFVTSYQSGKYLQPGYLTEVNLCATLAKKFNLHYDDSFTDGNLRHQYSNNGIYLKEFGGCGLSDIQLVLENGTTITIEVKEPLSLGGDFDLGITEQGKLFPKIKAGRQFPAGAQSILDDFNEIDSIFNHLGHNIPLDNAEYLKSILNSYLGDKHIDYIASYSANDELIYFPTNEIYDHVDFKGSEIRTAGKNNVKVYTPEAFKTAMISIGCSINNNMVTIPKDKVSFRIARGSNGKVTGIKINPIFFFEFDKISEDDDFYYANINDGKQLKQGISVHLNLK